MTKVWEWSQAEGAVLLVALALADHADDDGYCYPGVERIAKKCRISARSVQRHIAALCDMKELEVALGKGVTVQGGSTNRYRLTVNNREHQRTPPNDRDDVSGDRLTPGDNSTGKVVTDLFESGDKAVSPKPLGKPSVESSRASIKSKRLSDDEFLQSIKDNPAFKGIDIDRELLKMDAWLITKPGRKKTRAFIVNWLNKIDQPLSHEQTPKQTNRSSNGAVGTSNERVVDAY